MEHLPEKYQLEKDSQWAAPSVTDSKVVSVYVKHNMDKN